MTLAAPVTQHLKTYDDACAWYGPAMAKRTDWTLALTAEDVAELDRAVAHAIATDIDLVTLTAAQFPLPTLGPKLRQVRHQLLHGCAIALLRGWPSGERSLRESATAFYGIGTHLGEPISQNGLGHVLGHVANLGKDYKDPTTRGYQTKAELRFHTDGGDIVGLLCVRPGQSGGLSRVASSTTVWNEAVRRRPDLAAQLLAGYSFSRVGELSPGQSRAYQIPLFQDCQGRMIAFLVQSMIEKAQAFPEVPRLTDLQREALEFVDALASDDAIRLDMDFRPGDMQFLLNHSIFHSRTAYEDWPEPERRRHLLRLWLSCEDGPALPSQGAIGPQAKTTKGRPGGINVAGVQRVAPLEPC